MPGWTLLSPRARLACIWAASRPRRVKSRDGAWRATPRRGSWSAFPATASTRRLQPNAMAPITFSSAPSSPRRRRKSLGPRRVSRASRRCAALRASRRSPSAELPRKMQMNASARGPPRAAVSSPFTKKPAILSRSLERLRPTLEGEPVVVVDAGSRDGSAQIARRFFHTESEPEPNRGAQLNHGALCLSTDVLLFLHADSQLPAGFQTLIRTALLDPDVVGGCFRLQLD